MWNDLVVGILGNLIAFVILMLMAWFVLVVWRRRNLLRFFGVNRSRRVTIYISRLQIPKGGTIGADGKHRSYQGVGLPAEEAEVASGFRELFSYFLPGVAEKPGILRKLLVSDVKVRLKPAPQDASEIDNAGSIVTLGSPGYNEVSGWVEKDMHSLAKFQSDNSEIALGETSTFSGGQYGLVGRVLDTEWERPVFYAAGMSEGATMAATYFLMKQWTWLAKMFGQEKKFAVVIKIGASDWRAINVVDYLPQTKTKGIDVDSYIVRIICWILRTARAVTPSQVIEDLVPMLNSARHRFVDYWVLGNIFLSIAALSLIGVYEARWIHIVLFWLVVWGLIRVYEIVIHSAYIALCNPSDSESADQKDGVLSRKRLVVLALINYVELILWFAVFYLIMQLMLISPEISIDTIGRSLQYSLETMTLSRTSGLIPNEVSGIIFTSLQTIIGLFMALLIISRFIGMLPPLKKLN